MMRKNVIDAVNKEKLIVIVRGVEREKLIPLAEAMYDGGIRLLEITYNAKVPESDKETAENINMLVRHFGERMYIGAGTVLTAEQVKLTESAGGSFIISPNVKQSVIEKTRELGLVSMPGALTPSEIACAYDYGADFVKLFPITELGAGYVKAVRAPLSHIPMLAVGGVDLGNMKDYLKVGISGFGIGSNIIDKKMLASNDWDGICRLASEYVRAVQG
ncbi:MAG: bifunctional 4-hydroxy-2-oxoglutarate aldolase/2-dehydro-3-deoxy-phosphogluconate aldolase [Clostridia bacterium]|nr:bifunctional 4-hydroxy-2-oxoglutarate aldolase/2-dehydro-3-deoxy-phosphogluconate aldolase [Clostridia bacterium]MBQ8567135.1 bifunctional 4-hydroxy-2-oxoglutarate aldolase/2-dehydro-3-deoxy-phosphogluconate aldolase [Clostridia bacterium]